MASGQAVLGTLSADVVALAERLRAGVVRLRAGEHGMGSGVVWQVGEPGTDGVADATIITNAHVARSGHADDLTARLRDGREARAVVVALDPAHDLAALRLRAAGLVALEVGDSAALRVGELVLAVGNPFGREGAVTLGVVAARAPADPEVALEPAERDDASGAWRDPAARWLRERPEVIQADIQLYPGNSGGPLADARGRVVGINAMVGGGLAFAIPSRAVQHFLAEVAGATARPHLGIAVTTVALPLALRERLSVAQRGAALVVGVETESAAAAAGVLVGDLVLAVNGQPISDARQLPLALGRSLVGSGQPLALSLGRGGQRVELALAPATPLAA